MKCKQTREFLIVLLTVVVELLTFNDRCHRNEQKQVKTIHVFHIAGNEFDVTTAEHPSSNLLDPFAIFLYPFPVWLQWDRGCEIIICFNVT